MESASIFTSARNGARLPPVAKEKTRVRTRLRVEDSLGESLWKKVLTLPSPGNEPICFVNAFHKLISLFFSMTSRILICAHFFVIVTTGVGWLLVILTVIVLVDVTRSQLVHLVGKEVD